MAIGNADRDRRSRRLGNGPKVLPRNYPHDTPSQPYAEPLCYRYYRVITVVRPRTGARVLREEIPIPVSPQDRLS